MADTKGRITLEGSADGAIKAFQKAGQSSKEMSGSLREAAKGFDAQAEAAKRAETAMFVTKARMDNAKESAAAIDKAFGKVGESSSLAARGVGALSKAAHSGRGTMQALGSDIHQVAAGTMSLSSAVNDVLFTFGPWGAVLGAAAGALAHFAMKEYEAAEAAKEAAKELKRQQQAAADLARDAAAKKVVERLAREGNAAQDAEQKQRVADATEKIRATELEIAGLKSSAAERDLLELRLLHEQNELVRITGTLEEYQAAKHQEDLATIRLTVNEEKQRTKEKQKQTEFEKLLGLSAGAEKRFDAGMKRRGEAAQGMEDLDLRSMDEMPDEEWAAREKEFEDARTKFTQDQQQRREESRKAQHEAEKERLKEEADLLKEHNKKIEESAKTAANAANYVIGGLVSIREARQAAVKLAREQGKTEAEAARAGKVAAWEQAANVLKSIRDQAGAKALFEAAEAAAAFARYDFPGGAQHLIAAGLYGAVALGTGVGGMIVGSHADSMSSGGGGFGGPGFGGSANGGSSGGRGASPRSGTSPIDSHIPGSPTPAPHSTSPSGSRGGTVVHIHGDVLGSIDHEFVRRIDQSLDDLSHSRRPRRTG